jgi:hypothetical protein
MGKKKTKKQSPEETLAEVIKEMAKPRVASSAKEYACSLGWNTKKAEPWVRPAAYTSEALTAARS